MATQAIPFLTPEQYLEIERAAELRSEYFNGAMFAMSGATANHNRIVNRLGRTLDPQLRGCEYFTTDLRLLIPTTELYTYPDLMVICGKPAYAGDRQDIVTNPVIIAEVLSKSTANYDDRGDKFFHYRSIPSLRDYLLIAQDSVRIEHHAKQGDGSWLLREYSSLDDVVSIASISVEIRLREVYAGVDFGVAS
jgi:Uma2 family endonuclease